MEIDYGVFDTNPDPNLGYYEGLGLTTLNEILLNPWRSLVYLSLPPSDNNLVRIQGKSTNLLCELDWRGSVLSDDSLPPPDLLCNLSLWDWCVMDVNLTGSDDVLCASGSVTSVTVIPEPSTLVLFGFGFLGLVGIIIRQRRKGK